MKVTSFSSSIASSGPTDFASLVSDETVATGTGFTNLLFNEGSSTIAGSNVIFEDDQVVLASGLYTISGNYSQVNTGGETESAIVEIALYVDSASTGSFNGLKETSSTPQQERFALTAGIDVNVAGILTISLNNMSPIDVTFQINLQIVRLGDVLV